VRIPRFRALSPMVWALLVAALLLAPGGVGLAVAGEDVPARARDLIDKGHPAKAVPLLEDAAVARPGDAEVVFLLGLAYQRTGRRQDALIALTHAATLAPDDGLIRYNLGAVQFALERYDEAAESFLAVPSLDPRATAAAYLNAGLARYKAGRIEEAATLLARAIDAEPDGSTAATARRMLDFLSGPREAITAAIRKRRLSTSVSAGREFDSNVFALPDDGTTTDLSDWRNTVTGEVEYRVPVSGRFDVTPHYDFYGHWYRTEHAYNYRRHRVWLRLDDRGGALRPRVTWGYDFAELGGDAYLASNWLDGRLTLHRGDHGGVWVRAGVALDEAPGHQYDYLSGTSWEAVLYGSRDALADGWAYAALRARYRDRGTANVTYGGIPVRVDYSYASVEPRVGARSALPWGFRTTAILRYEVRRYLNDDTWGNPPAGSKRRLDKRSVVDLTLSRALTEWLRLSISWTGQVRHSNITAADYRDRDYDRQVYGAFLEGDW
jgi:tetratricopeptide (TPR) repeat protein